MNNYKSPYSYSLKPYTKLIESHIPLKTKIIAELRLIWQDIVGEKMSLRSQAGKCEYIPKKNNLGNPTGEFYRRIIIWVNDANTINAMTAFSAEYLERIPKKYKIHSLRIQLLKNTTISILDKRPLPQKASLHLSINEKNIIKNKLENVSLSFDLKKQLFHYLCLCKSLNNQNL